MLKVYLFGVFINILLVLSLFLTNLYRNKHRKLKIKVDFRIFILITTVISSFLLTLYILKEVCGVYGDDLELYAKDIGSYKLYAVSKVLQLEYDEYTKKQWVEHLFRKRKSFDRFKNKFGYGKYEYVSEYYREITWRWYFIDEIRRKKK
ncbi:MAG: hypothetical protein ACRDDY_04300 [Clostridium sp.]|uniref:hypothetical protein n=1 Tax=Clostridium sp. TaxID=1506 RepID=UPI003EE556F8